MSARDMDRRGAWSADPTTLM